MTGAQLIANLAGIVGVGLVLACYFLVQVGRMEARSMRFQLLNMAACLLIGVSLIFAFNLPSAIIQACWFTISALGLACNLSNRSTANRVGRDKPD